MITRSAYGYVGNSPLNGTDPAGLASVDLPGGACFRVPFTSDDGCQGADGPSGINCVTWHNPDCQSLADQHPKVTLGLHAVAVVALIVATGGLALADLGVIGAGSAGATATIGGFPTVQSPVDKLSVLSDKFGIASCDLVNDAMANGSRYVDTANDNNINVFMQRPDGADGLVRVTLDPTGQRIISAGLAQSNNVANGIANGRFKPLGG